MANVRVEARGSVGTIFLDRPQRGNALSLEMVRELDEALADLQRERKVRGVVLMGRGPHFCTGADLTAVRQAFDDDAAQHAWQGELQDTCEVLLSMLRFPKPLVAAIDGAAMGTGLALVLACDYVVASETATFGAPEARRGLVPGLTVPLAVFRLGAARATPLLLSGASVMSEVAVAQGWVHERVKSEQVWAAAARWIESLESTAAESLQLTKRLINETVGETLAMFLATGAASTATARTTDAAKEGVAAFLEKRVPRWP